MDETSGVKGDFHAPFCGSRGGRFPRATRRDTRGLWPTCPTARPRSFGAWGPHAPIRGGCGPRAPYETRDPREKTADHAVEEVERHIDPATRTHTRGQVHTGPLLDHYTPTRLYPRIGRSAE